MDRRSRDGRRKTGTLASRVSRLAVLAAACLALAGATFGATDELSVARQALRDGFWSLARTHAQDCARTNDAARLVILEAWAGEGKWAEIPRSLDGWGSPAGDAFAYYRALALAKTGENLAVGRFFAGGLPKDPVYGRLAARLLAELALARGEPAEAAKTLGQIAHPAADDLILLAEAQSRLDRPKDAAALWRRVLADTNASVRATVTAAANLGDEKALRAIGTNGVPEEVRTLVSLRLGRLLLADPAKFDEGARMIRQTVTATPDAEGALDAFRALASARLGRKDWEAAARAFREILEIWPSAARVASVQEGLGWALLKLGRTEEALQAFRLAEACATTDADQASAAAKTADALAALGRPDESSAKCREVMSRWPDSSAAKVLAAVMRLRARETEGRALYAQFRFAEAQKAFQEVAAGDPVRRGRMAFFEILCLFGQGRDREAETRARALAKATDDPRLRADVTEWLARKAYNDGRWRDAQDLFHAFAVSPSVSPADAADARVWAARAALAANEFPLAISNATEVIASAAPASAQAEAKVIQGEALLELARFDEAVLVFDQAAHVAEASPKVRLGAQILRADALYALGADNPIRYEQALAAYREIARAERIPEESRLTLAYKIGTALEKLKRRDEAIDQYYTHVVLAYRDARTAGRRLDDTARADFARAAFRLADLCEANGHYLQAQKTLELVATSDVPAAVEALKRLDRLRKKGVLP